MIVTGRRTLRHLLRERAGLHPERTFAVIEQPDGTTLELSYAAFFAQVNRAAHGFASLGIVKGDRVVVHLTNRAEFLYAWFGLATLGAVTVPTIVQYAADELAYVVNHSEARAVITEPAFTAVMEAARAESSSLQHLVLCGDVPSAGWRTWSSIVEGRPSTQPDVDVNPLDDAAFLYTSGTTSRPKAVQITHANYLYAGEVMARQVRLAPEDRYLVVLPLFHGNAQYYCTMPALTVGASIALMPRFSVSRYWAQARWYQATIGSLFAAPMRMLLAHPPGEDDAAHRLRLMLFAMSVTPGQLESFEGRFRVPLAQLYGMTETLAVPLMNPTDGVRKNMSIGLPTLGCEVRLVTENGREAAVGEVGQIVMSGLPGWTVMKGYFRNDEATAAALRSGWLHTGDNGSMDEDGYISFVDRARDMIKRAGENIAAQEVERVLNAHPAVYESAVIGVPDPIRDYAIKAFVQMREGARVEVGELITHCAQSLARFKMPEQIEFVTGFPRTAVGKIQKHLLRNPRGGAS